MNNILSNKHRAECVHTLDNNIGFTCFTGLDYNIGLYNIYVIHIRIASNVHFVHNSNALWDRYRYKFTSRSLVSLTRYART